MPKSNKCFVFSYLALLNMKLVFHSLQTKETEYVEKIKNLNHTLLMKETSSISPMSRHEALATASDKSPVATYQ